MMRVSVVMGAAGHPQLRVLPPLRVVVAGQVRSEQLSHVAVALALGVRRRELARRGVRAVTVVGGATALGGLGQGVVGAGRPLPATAGVRQDEVQVHELAQVILLPLDGSGAILL